MSKPKQHVSLAKVALWVFLAMLAGATALGLLGGSLALLLFLLGGVIGPLVWVALLIFSIGTAVAYSIANGNDDDDEGY